MPTLNMQNLARIAEILTRNARCLKEVNTLDGKWISQSWHGKQAKIDYDELLYLARCCRAEAKRARVTK